MNNFRNTFRVKTSELLSFPIKEGQTYFDTERGILYRDENGQRFALANVFKVDDLNLTEYVLNQKKLLNSIIINKDTSNDTFQTYYVKEDGTVTQLTSGGGGSTYFPGDGVQIDITNVISVDSTILRKLTENWIIENEEQNFAIKQNNVGIWDNASYSATAVGTLNEPVVGAQCFIPGAQIYEFESAYYICNAIADPSIITIYKEPQTSGGVTDAKVNINAKTTISELDFGG